MVLIVQQKPRHRAKKSDLVAAPVVKERAEEVVVVGVVEVVGDMEVPVAVAGVEPGVEGEDLQVVSSSPVGCVVPQTVPRNGKRTYISSK